MKIDKIYVINLNTDEDIIWGKLRDLNIRPTDCRITKAINGWEVVKGTEKPPFKYKAANWWKIEHNNSFFNREVTPGEMGCGLSHYECVKLGYDEGHETILILEEIISEEMIEILKLLGIDQNLVPIIQITKTLREKFLAEIIIMLQN